MNNEALKNVQFAIELVADKYGMTVEEYKEFVESLLKEGK